MSNLDSLRARLAEINRQSEAISGGAAAMERPLNEDERAKLDTLSTEFQAIEADIARLETIERQKSSVSGQGSAAGAAGTAAGSQRPDQSTSASAVAASPAGVKRAETMLLALGVILAVFALLSIIGGDVMGLIIQGAVSLLTFLIGYKAIKDGNIGTARTFSLTMGWIYAGLQILFLLLVISIVDYLGPLFWIMWAIGWAFAWGYFYSYQCLTPKAQRKMGL